MSDVQLTIVPQSPIQITIGEPSVQVLEINPPAVIELSNVTTIEGTGGGTQTILGTENEIVVTTVDDVSTISIADPLITTGISATEIAATDYYGSNMELYGSISLPYGNLTAPAGTITAPHHHGNLLGGVEVEVKNTYAGTLPKGHPVWAVGSVGATDVIEVYPSSADSYQTVPILGLLSQELTHNQTGHAITHGLLQGLDTSQWDAGDNIWVASTSQVAGVKYYGLSSSEPANSSDYNQRCAVVVRSNNNNGSLLVLGGDAAGKTIAKNISFENINNCTGLDDATYIYGTTIVWQGSGWSPASPGFFAPFSQTTYLNGESYYDPSYGNVTYGPLVPDMTTSSSWDGKVAKWDETNSQWVSITASESGHTHSGADITSGTVAFARLPTGTSSSQVAIGNHTHSGADITSGTVGFSYLPTGTGASQVAIGNHTHTLSNITDYVAPSDPADPTTALCFVEDFIPLAAETGEIGYYGWSFGNSTIVNLTAEAGHPGILRMRCPTTSGTTGWLSTQSNNTGFNCVHMTDLTEFTFVFREATVSNNLEVLIGMCDIYSAPGNITYGMYIRKVTGGANYTLNFENNNTLTTVNNFLTPDTSWHKIKFKKNGSSWEVYKDGTLFGTYNTNIPTGIALSPCMMQTPNAVVNINTDLDFFSFKTGTISR